MSFTNLIFQSAAEGCVLLKNEEEMLPLKRGDSVCVFGRCQKDFYKSGMGSGGSVHVIYSTILIDELLKAENESGVKIDRKLADLYEEWHKKNPFDNGGGQWAGEPWSQKEMPVSKDLAEEYAKNNSKALYVIGRNAGEDKDLKSVKGSWYLSDTEYENLVNICSAFENVAVIFNTCGIMDTSFIEDSAFKGHIKAASYVWMGGMEAGSSTAALLLGKENFSGKLTDTIAKNIEDYPSTKNFGNEKENIYQEDIYVGYRYFNTFAKDKILYPFGYGLSYTEFKSEIIDAYITDLDVTVKAKITNTGKCSGKDVLEVYVEAPQGKLGKASRVLAGFTKTSLLKSGQSEEVCIKFNLKDSASYDDCGVTGSPYCWILEAGKYFVYAGSDSLSAEKINIGNKDCIELNENVIVTKCRQAGAPYKKFQRMINKEGSSSYEDVPLNKNDLNKIIHENLPPQIPFTGDKGISFDDVKKDPVLLESFIGQLDVKELATIVRGEGMMSAKVTMGITAAYGGLSEKLHDYKIPVAGCADGPSGIRVDTGREASLMPIGTQLACSWNLALVEELFVEEGKELVQYQIDSLLGPGINIHRNPLNGRNFEYFSEDPYLTGVMAAVQIRGLKKGGSSGTIKHYACNSQELCRNSSDSVLSERALREIYLKAFEIVVKDKNLVSLMTSYNPVNGHWSASNYETVNMILRQEWKYKGLVMTDWWAKMNHCVKGGEASIKNTAYMIRARNDIYMIVDNDTAESNGYGDNIEKALAEGELTLGELQLCVKDILRFILQAPVSKRPLRALKEILEFSPANTAVPSDGKIVNEKDDFVPDENTWLKVEHKGVFNISGTYIKESDDLSQSVSNIMIDGQPAASLECRSTAGIFTTVNASQVILNPGIYHLTLEHTKPGITVSKISFNSQVITPVSMGVIK
ncbi:glycoside hydrolase family 3 N-terminal domain-containing protein [Treponema sp.]|uniref:glycoside hydrolase family 3 C-terminal domain-containing protein n=1 Tax=Treponema sp. TaxID=166 RepID=UPI0025ECD804|nr:glycoside hydrolase family 3 N-terminal domain-containing protein [Treponema sp.]MCR5217794.1 glycoside hydrolase family 3 C-terminal domain-containing protein [Treponema sp.]